MRIIIDLIQVEKVPSLFCAQRFWKADGHFKISRVIPIANKNPSISVRS